MSEVALQLAPVEAGIPASSAWPCGGTERAVRPVPWGPVSRLGRALVACLGAVFPVIGFGRPGAPPNGGPPARGLVNLAASTSVHIAPNLDFKRYVSHCCGHLTGCVCRFEPLPFFED